MPPPARGRWPEGPEGVDLISPPPTSEADLLARARALAGLTVGELASRLGIDVPPDPRRSKGLVGRLVEQALGAEARSTDAPDFTTLGIELKTIPVRADGRPRESTFVCTIDLRGIADAEWATSRARRKLAQVLWVPVQAASPLPLAARRIGTPILWSPSPAEEEALRTDWEDLVGTIARGDVDLLTAHSGRCLQVRPKAANAHARRRASDASGAPVRALPRGFYLRADFTARILARALAAPE